MELKKKMKLKEKMKEKRKVKEKGMAIFVLEDDNEIMSSALNDEDFNEENKQMNRELIENHKKVIAKLEDDKELTEMDLILISDANEIHVNDKQNIAEHHNKAIKLQKEINNLIIKGIKNESENKIRRRK